VRRHIAGGIVLVAALAVSAVEPAFVRAAPVPASSPDAFYDAPSDLGASPPGTVVRSRPVSVPAYGITLPVRAWQFVYRSNDTRGNAIAATTTLIVPPSAPPGPRPVISYQAAINSLNPECSPSRSLPGGSIDEIFMILWPLLRGWAVAIPDHGGPHSAYGAGRLAADRAGRCSRRAKLHAR